MDLTWIENRMAALNDWMSTDDTLNGPTHPGFSTGSRRQGGDFLQIGPPGRRDTQGGGASLIEGGQ